MSGTTTAPETASGSADPAASTYDSTVATDGTSFAGTASSTTAEACVPEGLSPVCSILCQDCPDEQKCGLSEIKGNFGGATVTCLPLDPKPVALGESCTPDFSGATDECVPGGHCNLLGGPFACDELCVPPYTEYDCALPTARCFLPYAAVDHGYGLCQRTCDPFVSNWCGVGAPNCAPYHPDCDLTKDVDCYPMGSEGSIICLLAAGHSQERAHGQPCGSERDCDEGSSRLGTCVPGALVPGCAEDSCCSSFCDLTAPDPDSQCALQASGEVCLPYFAAGAAPPGSEKVGLCRLP